MSLPRYGEDKKPTEPKSSKPTTQESTLEQSQPEQKRAYITNEMRRQSQKHLEERNAAKKKAEALQMLEDTTTEIRTEPIPIPELDEIEMWATDLTVDLQGNTEDAKNNERVMLMATSVIKMCRLLRNFSVVMTAEMAKIAERELQNLNIQSQYAKSVKASIVEVTRDIYHQFKDEQAQAFKDVQKYLSDSCDDMEKEINACTAEVKKATASAVNAAKNVSATTRKLRRVKTFGDLMYYAAPLFVVIDIILRVIALAGHFG